jgi:murein DD-endopeptidase MepM/ murein hydrolase activator NlpD
MTRYSSKELAAIKKRISSETGVRFAQTGVAARIHTRRALILAAILVLGTMAAAAAHRVMISKRVLQPAQEQASNAVDKDVQPGLPETSDYVPLSEDQETVNGFYISFPFEKESGEVGSPVRRPGHKGIDIAAPKGTPVLAAAGGTVRESEFSAERGNYVVIDHEEGASTVYAHLEKLLVEPGQLVEAGEQIGTVGSTGMATGPHLHFELRINDEPVDPSDYWE